MFLVVAVYPENRTQQFFESDTVIPSVGAFSLTPGNNIEDEDDLEEFIKEVLKILLFNQGLITLDYVSGNY